MSSFLAYKYCSILSDGTITNNYRYRYPIDYYSTTNRLNNVNAGSTVYYTGIMLCIP